MTTVAERVKVCTGCEESKPAGEFYRRAQSPTGLTPQCKPCTNAYNKKWIEADPSRRERQRAWIQAYNRKKKYGLDEEAHAAMLAEQGGGCAICGTDTPGGWGAFHVDHDHACCPDATSCGRCVRGLLCMTCNFALGAVKDDPSILEAMAAYLEANMFAPAGSQRPNMSPTPKA